MRASLSRHRCDTPSDDLHRGLRGSGLRSDINIKRGSVSKPFLKLLLIPLKVSITVLAGMLCCFPALATELCHDLPSSQLMISHVFTNRVEEEPAEVDNLPHDFPSGVVASYQPMMVSAITLYSKFGIRNRTLHRDDGSVCASPELVEL